MNINLNDVVSVRLTPTGKKHLENHFKSHGIDGTVINKGIDSKSSNDVFKTELWDLFHIFGDGLYMGNPEIPFFEYNTITLEIESC